MEDSKIMITLVKPGVATVWDKDDVIRLKQELRIPGTLLGSLPRKPWQNQVMSLPLLLMPEEVTLLLHKGFAYVTSKHVGTKSASEQNIQDFKTLRDKSLSDQVALFVQGRENKIRQYRHISNTGKLKKGDECPEHFSLDKGKCGDKQDTCAELQNLHPISMEKAPIMQLGDQEMPKDNTGIESVAADDMKYYSKATWVHVPTTRDTWSSLSQSVTKGAEDIHWRFPLSVQDKSRYAVFCDLWEQGYYVTNGAKFGSDYLLYPGDPSRYHSHYIVKIMPSTELCIPHELLAYARLASAVKKTFVLAIVNIDDLSVKYSSISWTSME